MAIFDFIRQNATELLGFVTGAACVWLIVKENIWNWPIGIANNLFYIFLFFRAGLFADVGLQGFYITIGLYGWWNWLHGGRGDSDLPISRTGAVEGLLLVTGTGLLTACLAFLLIRFTPSTVPWWDGLTTALSITAQWMMAKKKLEHWLFWIVTDALSIGLFIYKHLYLTAGLYFIFGIMCALGLRQWMRTWRTGQDLETA